MTLPGKILAVGFAAMVLLASAANALAQTIPVKSGEHEDFSRLVLDFPDTVQWQFGRVDGGYEFRSDHPDARFSLGKVFSFIPRKRIKSVADLGQGRLFLAVDCDCYGDAFDLRDGRIVLDIKDGAPLASAQIFNQRLPGLTAEPAIPVDQTPSHLVSGSPLAASVSGMDPSTPSAAVPAMMASDVRSPIEIRRGLPLLLMQAGQLSQPPTDQPSDAPAPPAPTEPEQPEQPADHSGPANLDMPPEMAGTRQLDTAQGGNDRVAQTHRELLQQIGRAAAQGLLQADMSRTDAILAQAKPPSAAPPEAESPPKNPPPPPPEPEDHVIIQTAIDRQFSIQGQPDTVTEDGLACPQDEYFDVANWGEDPSNGIDLGPYRNALVGEFDAPHPEAVSALAKYYIYLTFGAEATALLNTYDLESDQVKYLRILARIMDHENPENGQVLAPYAACGGKVALWALLSVDHLDPLQDLNAEAISSTFSALPIHLRKYLAQPLVSRLLEIGEVDLATMIRNSVDRAESKPDPSAVFVEAQLQMSEGSADAAVSALEEVAFGNSDHAAEALLELISLKLEKGMEVTEKEIATAASFAFEQRGTEIGHALQVAEINALAATARFPEAFERFKISDARGDLPAQDRDAVLSGILRNLAEKASDAQFLRFALDLAAQAPLSSDARMAVASRFVDLGFNKEARTVLSQSVQLPGAEERLLFARIAIAEEKYNVALGYLAGLETADALRLRARALAGQQEMQAAIEAYSQAGDTQAALQLAWRDGDWPQVSMLDDDVLAAASRLKQTPFAPSSDQSPQEPILSTDADLLARSEQTREVISKLMRRFPIQK